MLTIQHRNSIMKQIKCKAKNPETCRYHAERNLLHELRDKADQAALEGDAETYLKLKDKADRIAEIYEESEESSIIE